MFSDLFRTGEAGDAASHAASLVALRLDFLDVCIWAASIQPQKPTEACTAPCAYISFAQSITPRRQRRLLIAHCTRQRVVILQNG
jgi:hypothetical protein